MTKQFSITKLQCPNKKSRMCLVIGFLILEFAWILFLGNWYLTSIAFAGEPDDSVAKDLLVDKEHKIISYALTKPATVRLRVGTRSGPLYRNLANWNPQEKGKHVIRWDGMDSSGLFDILDSKNFIFSFNYYLTNENEPIRIFSPQQDSIVISDNFIGRAPKYIQLSRRHKNHIKKYCKDIVALFELPADVQKTKQGIYVIKGAVPITISLPPKDKTWFSRERFSINIFIDDVFIKGEALAYTPYTWNFNPEGINKGRHLITVNIKNFNDHIAIGNLPLQIEAAK